MDDAQKKLVIGAPRMGFTLLISILNELEAINPHRQSPCHLYLRHLIPFLGAYLDQFVNHYFNALCGEENVIYNGEFRSLVGGPKWLDAHNTRQAGIRKYVGLKDNGDFMVAVYFPREVLNVDDVVHSHYNPALWVNDQEYAAYRCFSCIRNPVGVVNSGAFSLNALTSEYVTRYVSHLDETTIREQVATYKLSDMELVRGLAQFVKDYLEEYMPVRHRYYEMRWEDLILNPISTIRNVAKKANIPASTSDVEKIWAKLDHVNLPQFHKHNYRKGKGVVGDWKNSLVNEHLELFRDMGLLEWNAELGYNPVPFLNESSYNPFQQRVAAAIRKGEVIESVHDRNIFTFAWNKSNITNTSHSEFKRYNRDGCIHLERSCLKDDAFIPEFSGLFKQKVEAVNRVLTDALFVLAGVASPTEAITHIAQSIDDHLEAHALSALRQEREVLINALYNRNSASQDHAGRFNWRRYARAIKRRFIKEGVV